jgi:hypothetical protein
VGTSKRQDCSNSTVVSEADPEPLDFDTLPLASPEVAEALERNRPGPMTLVEYAKFLKQFHWTKEQLDAIPVDDAPRFTLDD